MADPPPSSDSRPHATPRWVKVFGIIAVVLALLVVLLRTGVLGGEHGPGRHLPGGGGGQTPPAGVTEDHIPPIEHGP